MGFFSHLFYPWGLLLQGAAIVHFIRRRPDTYWLWVILFLGPIGAVVYLFAEAVPDVGLLRGQMKMFPRRKRIGQLMRGRSRQSVVRATTKSWAICYMDDGRMAQARAAFDQAIAARSDTLDAFYRRGVCASDGRCGGGVPDLERWSPKSPGTTSIARWDCWRMRMR